MSGVASLSLTFSIGKVDGLKYRDYCHAGTRHSGSGPGRVTVTGWDSEAGPCQCSTHAGGSGQPGPRQGLVNLNRPPGPPITVPRPDGLPSRSHGHHDGPAPSVAVGDSEPGSVQVTERTGADRGSMIPVRVRVQATCQSPRAGAGYSRRLRSACQCTAARGGVA